MKQTFQNVTHFVFALILISCDPDVNVDYNIVNETDEKLDVKIFGLRDQYNSIVQEYDTVIEQGQKVNIYRFWSLGSDYVNPADTITIFDSLQVSKNSVKAKPNFKNIDTWDYSEKKYRYGGGHYIYDLVIKSDDF